MAAEIAKTSSFRPARLALDDCHSDSRAVQMRRWFRRCRTTSRCAFWLRRRAAVLADFQS
jgi:hypothetical protein